MIHGAFARNATIGSVAVWLSLSTIALLDGRVGGAKDREVGQAFDAQ